MRIVKAEQIRDDVIGLKPVYCDIGNATDILLASGEVVRDRRVLTSVVKALAASYAVDLKAQRKILQEKLIRKAVLPFYLGTGRVFVPLKMRQAISENDAVYGYVNMAYIGETQAGLGKECLIELSNGIHLLVLSSQSTIHGALHAGKAALSVFEPYKIYDEQQDQVMEAGRLFTCVIAQIVQQLDRIERQTSNRQ